MRKERLLVMRPERTHDQISTQLCIFSIFLNFVYYGVFYVGHLLLFRSTRSNRLIRIAQKVSIGPHTNSMS